MKSFLNNIIQRHSNTVNSVKPRLRTIFEQENSQAATSQESSFGATSNSIEKPGQFENTSSTNNISNGPLHDNLRGANSVEVSQRHFDDENETSPENFVASLNSHSENLPKRENVLSQNKIVAENTDYSSHLVTPIREEQPIKHEVLNTNGKGQSEAINPIVTSTINADFQSGHETKPSSAMPPNTASAREQFTWTKNFKKIISGYGKGENSTSPPPAIKVNIGRIDVRASTQQTPVRAKSDPKAVMSLDDFLKKKNGN